MFSYLPYIMMVIVVATASVVVWREAGKSHDIWIIAVGCIIMVSLAIGRTQWRWNEEMETKLTDAERTISELHSKDFDVEKQKRLTEAAEAKVVKAEEELVAAKKEIDSLKAKVDTDGDKIADVDDKCPRSIFEEGGPTWVNSFGCTELEIADSCTASSQRLPGETEQYIWSNCTLSDQQDSDYICTVHLRPGEGFDTPSECHAAPYTLMNGQKSYGG